MRELSLHVLDLMENSIRAGASVVSVAVQQDSARNRLRLVVADNGPGLAVPAKVAADPFFTTKRGKRTGLGLSLFAAAAEGAAGKLTLRKSRLGGLSVEATMQLDHVDRAPLGDLATTLAAVAAANPELEIRCRLSAGKHRWEARFRRRSRTSSKSGPDGLSRAAALAEAVRKGIEQTRILC
jgi:anti-sigma regulatory factor (Ser/Thr protein kinase)